MGIKNFTKLIEPFYSPSKVPEYYDSILVDAQSFLYEGINYSLMPVTSDEFVLDVCKIAVEQLLETLAQILRPSRPESVSIVVSFDGEGVPMKWPTQRKRRQTANCSEKDKYRFALFGNNRISKTAQSILMEWLKTRPPFPNAKFVISGCNVTGEGEHKLFDIAERYSLKHPIVVSVDHDVFVIAMLRLERYDTVQIYRYKKFYHLSEFVKDVLPYPVRRLLVASTCFGNDFVPSLLEISFQNAPKIHTALSNSEDSYSPPETIHHFLSEMSDRMIFETVPYVEESMVIQFWITHFWIADYYRSSRFPQKYLKNSIFDSFNRNMLLTALLNKDYSKTMYFKAEDLYKNLSVSRPSISPVKAVFNEELRRKLSSFWFKNENTDEGICYEINVTKKQRPRPKRRPI